MTKKKKYEVTDKIKKIIIDYTRSVIDTYVDHHFFDSFPSETFTLLERIYLESEYQYITTGNYEITLDMLEEICRTIESIEECYELFSQGKIKLLAITEDQRFLYNLNPAEKYEFDKKNKHWKKIN